MLPRGRFRGLVLAERNSCLDKRCYKTVQRSPYGVAKLTPRSVWLARIERHPFQPREPVRGETFVTRKIMRGVAAIKKVYSARFISAISMQSGIGVARVITSKACGACCTGMSREITAWWTSGNGLRFVAVKPAQAASDIKAARNFDMSRSPWSAMAQTRCTTSSVEISGQRLRVSARISLMMLASFFNSSEL